MANVPLPVSKLEDITKEVAQELLENWAINDRFEEDKFEKAVELAVEDTALVINAFMEKLNQAMLETSEEKKNLII